jgi:WD40 repeat protein
MAKSEFTVIKCQTSKRLECDHLCFAPDSRTILGCVSPNTLAQWDAETGNVIARVHVPRSSHSFALKYSPDGKWVALAGEKQVVVVDAKSFKILKSVVFVERAIYDSLDWSHDGQLIAVGGTNLQAACWNPATGKVIMTKPREDNAGFVAFFNRPDQILFSCDDEVFAWSPESNKERRLLKLKSRDGYCWDHALSPDKSTLISVSERGCLLKTNTRTWRSNRSKTATSSCGHQFGFSPNGRLLAMTANIDIVHVLNVETGRPLFKWRQPNRLAAFSPVFSPDGQRLACSLDSELFLLKFHENVESQLG